MTRRLLPGMFAKVSVVLPDKQDVVIVPVQSVVHASFGDSLFIVEDRKDSEGHAVDSPDGAPKVARQQFVKLGETRGDFVAVLDGLAAGQEVVVGRRLQASQRRAGHGRQHRPGEGRALAPPREPLRAEP